MIEKKIVVKNPTGLHLRPAGVLCDTAVRYKAHIMFRYGDDMESEANAKSVLSILGSCVKYGDTIELVTDGPDEEEAMNVLSKLFDGGFGEA
jgi:phosphocarrier protein